MQNWLMKKDALAAERRDVMRYNSGAPLISGQCAHSIFAVLGPTHRIVGKRWEKDAGSHADSVTHAVSLDNEVQR